MELTRITQSDFAGHLVSELADTPDISTTALKKKFDEASTEVIASKFNELAESLEELNIDKRVESDDITNLKMDEDGNITISTDGGVIYKKTNSTGHKIVNGAGIVFESEPKMQFSENVVITDLPDKKTTLVQIPAGPKGDRGEGATITLGTVEEGETARIENVGSEQDAIFNFTLPKGEKGDASTLTVGTTTTGNAGEPAQVINSGTRSDAVFNFVIPKGDKGDPGTGLTLLDTYPTLADLKAAHPTGVQGQAYIVGDTTDNTVYLWSRENSDWMDVGKLKGEQGEKGNSGTLQFGDVEAVPQGSEYVQNIGTTTDAILKIGLPMGNKGDKGDAATISVGTVTTGDDARVVNVGTPTNAVFDITLPRGEEGKQGNPTVINGKTGASVTLFGTDITLSPDDPTPISEMKGGATLITKEELDALDKSTLEDGDQFVIKDDYESKICQTLAECEASESLDDVVGASVVKELNRVIPKVTTETIESFAPTKNAYKTFKTLNITDDKLRYMVVAITSGTIQYSGVSIVQDEATLYGDMTNSSGSRLKHMCVIPIIGQGTHNIQFFVDGTLASIKINMSLIEIG